MSNCTVTLTAELVDEVVSYLCVNGFRYGLISRARLAEDAQVDLGTWEGRARSLGDEDLIPIHTDLTILLMESLNAATEDQSDV